MYEDSFSIKKNWTRHTIKIVGWCTSSSNNLVQEFDSRMIWPCMEPFRATSTTDRNLRCCMLDSMFDWINSLCPRWDYFFNRVYTATPSIAKGIYFLYELNITEVGNWIGYSYSDTTEDSSFQLTTVQQHSKGYILVRNS